MPAPPVRTALADTYPLPSNATFRTGIGALYDYITGLLGTVGTAADARATLGVPDQVGYRNRLFNPSGGEVYQRAVAATADDTYFADRWYALTQTGTVMPSVLTAPEDGYAYGCRLTQSQASAQRFGFAQIIEGRFCKDMRGGSGIMVPRVRISDSQAIRYAILGWTGTEDSVTSDVVLDWTSASYTAGGFFLASNVSVIAVGAQTPSANTWTSLASISAALGSTFNNIVIMVWTEGTAAQNVTLDWDWVQFEKGAIATPSAWRANELDLCQRYYYRITGADTASNSGMIGTGMSQSTTAGRAFIPAPVMLRTVPTALEQSGVSANYRIIAGSAGSIVCSAVPTYTSASRSGMDISWSVSSGATAEQGIFFGFNSAGAYIGMSAEL